MIRTDVLLVSYYNHKNVIVKLGAADKVLIRVKLNISIVTAVNHKGRSIRSLMFVIA